MILKTLVSWSCESQDLIAATRYAEQVRELPASADDFSECLLEIGLTYRHSQQFALESESYIRLIQLQQCDGYAISALAYMAESRALLGDLGGALQCFSRADRLLAEYPGADDHYRQDARHDPWLTLGTFFQRHGEFEAAIGCYRRWMPYVDCAVGEPDMVEIRKTLISRCWAGDRDSVIPGWNGTPRVSAPPVGKPPALAGAKRWPVDLLPWTVVAAALGITWLGRAIAIRLGIVRRRGAPSSQ